MDIRPLHTADDYKAALADVSALVDMDPASGSPEGDRLEIMATLIERYEADHFPMELPDPIEAIRFRMEQGGLTARDMEPYIGNLNRVLRGTQSETRTQPVHDQATEPRTKDSS